MTESLAEKFWDELRVNERIADLEVLRDRHGSAVIDRYIAAGDDATKARWTSEGARYTTAELAIDTALNRDAVKLRQLLPWIEGLPRAKGPIVDLGSGEGLLTCFVALLNSDQPVLGLDLIPEAAATATEIAEQLGVANVTFDTADCLDQLDSVPGHPFDTATAFTFFAPALGLPTLELDPWPARALAQLLEHVPELPGLGDVVREGGSLVTADRFSGSYPSWWFEVTHRAGYQMCDDLQMLPMSMEFQLYCSVARRTGRPVARGHLYVRHITEGLIAVSEGGALGLLVGNSGEEPSSVSLDPRDVSKLARALTRRHIDFADRTGALTIFRNSATATIVVRSERHRHMVTLGSSDVEALREGLEQLSGP